MKQAPFSMSFYWSPRISTHEIHVNFPTLTSTSDKKNVLHHGSTAFGIFYPAHRQSTRLFFFHLVISWELS